MRMCAGGRGHGVTLRLLRGAARAASEKSRSRGGAAGATGRRAREGWDGRSYAPRALPPLRYRAFAACGRGAAGGASPRYGRPLPGARRGTGARAKVVGVIGAAAGGAGGAGGRGHA
jgi:hypothetical protein